MDFKKKVVFVTILIIVLLVLKETFSVLLMILAASIIALYFYGLADLLQRKIKTSHKWSMFLSFVITFLILFILAWVIGAKIQEQVSNIREQLPQMVEDARSRLSQYSWGQSIINQISDANSEKYMNIIQRFFNSTFGILGDLYLIFFLTLFFLTDPYVYRTGIIALVAIDKKQKAYYLLDELANHLKGWFKGRLISMLFVGVATGIGLQIIGAPMVLALAVSAGLLDFIPNFGPVIALIPAVLVGMTVDMQTTWMIVALYLGVQLMEGMVVNPTVQRKLVKIPPALIITGQIVIGSVTGYLGVILATPVVLIIMVLVKELYIKDTLE